jgi:hypothetical protein
VEYDLLNEETWVTTDFLGGQRVPAERDHRLAVLGDDDVTSE